MDREAQWRKQRGTLVSVTIATIMALGIVCFALIACGGYAIGAMIVIAAFTGLGAIHYFLWGRGMNEEVAAERRIEELRALEVNPPPYEDDEPHDYRRF